MFDCVKKATKIPHFTLIFFSFLRILQLNLFWAIFWSTFSVYFYANNVFRWVKSILGKKLVFRISFSKTPHIVRILVPPEGKCSFNLCVPDLFFTTKYSWSFAYSFHNFQPILMKFCHHIWTLLKFYGLYWGQKSESWIIRRCCGVYSKVIREIFSIILHGSIKTTVFVTGP